VCSLKGATESGRGLKEATFSHRSYRKGVGNERASWGRGEGRENNVMLGKGARERRRKERIQRTNTSQVFGHGRKEGKNGDGGEEKRASRARKAIQMQETGKKIEGSQGSKER